MTTLLVTVVVKSSLTRRYLLFRSSSDAGINQQGFDQRRTALCGCVRLDSTPQQFRPSIPTPSWRPPTSRLKLPLGMCVMETAYGAAVYSHAQPACTLKGCWRLRRGLRRHDDRAETLLSCLSPSPGTPTHHVRYTIASMPAGISHSLTDQKNCLMTSDRTDVQFLLCFW
jgi:hypothetical protein